MSDSEFPADDLEGLKETALKNPNDVNSHLNLGDAFIGQMNGQEALDAYMKALL